MSFAMTEKEYQEGLEALRKKRIELDTEYALSNSPYQSGDIIQDHYHIIRIEEIRMVKKYNGTPQCLYMGVELTKALQPKKRQLDTAIYQENVKRKIK